MPVIKSNSDPDNPAPWFDFDFDTSDLSVTLRKANGMAASPETTATQADEQALVDNSSHSNALNSNKNAEIHVLAVRMDGEMEFVPQSEQKGVYYAHLAWYDPSDGTVDKLTFESNNG